MAGRCDRTDRGDAGVVAVRPSARAIRTPGDLHGSIGGQATARPRPIPEPMPRSFAASCCSPRCSPSSSSRSWRRRRRWSRGRRTGRGSSTCRGCPIRCRVPAATRPPCGPAGSGSSQGPVDTSRRRRDVRHRRVRGDPATRGRPPRRRPQRRVLHQRRVVGETGAPMPASSRRRCWAARTGGRGRSGSTSASWGSSVRSCKARLDLCAAKGFDAVEFDNVDGYQNRTGFPLTGADQLATTCSWRTRRIVAGCSAVLKNDLGQINDAAAVLRLRAQRTVPPVRRVRAPRCRSSNAGKAVFGVEYKLAKSEFCPRPTPHELQLPEEEAHA